MSVLDEAYRKQTRELNAALASAQAEFPPIPQDRKVEVEAKSGARYSYTYAPLESILAAVRPVLAKHGLALLQLLEDDGRGPALRTELRHSGGGLVSGTFPLPRVPEDPQALGSMLTYLRRYAVTAVLGIATERDDDGERAKPKPRASRSQPKPAEPSQPRPMFEPPEAKPEAELAPLVTEVQHRFETLRKLEAQLEIPQRRDWTQWVRVQLGLKGGEVGNPDQYRRAIRLLEAEEAKLIRKLEEKSGQGG
jgi:hypothetical protein